jgi:hypothetical protein
MAPQAASLMRPFALISAVDLDTGQIIDVFDGRNAADLQRSLAEQPADWMSQLDLVSVDPREGYRSAIVGHPLLAEVTVVVDGFAARSTPTDATPALTPIAAGEVAHRVGKRPQDARIRCVHRLPKAPPATPTVCEGHRAP